MESVCKYGHARKRNTPERQLPDSCKLKTKNSPQKRLMLREVEVEHVKKSSRKWPSSSGNVGQIKMCFLSADFISSMSSRVSGILCIRMKRRIYDRRLYLWKNKSVTNPNICHMQMKISNIQSPLHHCWHLTRPAQRRIVWPNYGTRPRRQILLGYWCRGPKVKTKMEI